MREERGVGKATGIGVADDRPDLSPDKAAHSTTPRVEGGVPHVAAAKEL
jgi:hypothetical protein